MYKTQQKIVKVPDEESDREKFDRFLLLTYGITIDQYERVYKMQEGACAICKSHESAKGRFVIAVDIDGKQRGLVCNRCKMGASFFNNDVALFQAAAALLEPIK